MHASQLRPCEQPRGRRRGRRGRARPRGRAPGFVTPSVEERHLVARVERRLDDCAPDELRAAEDEDLHRSSATPASEPVDLLLGVVVDEARPDGAHPLVEAESPHRLERVVVAPPDGDLVLVGQVRRDLLGGAAGNVEAERRHATLHRRQAVEVDAVGEAVEEPLPERALVCEHRVPADRVDVVDRRDEAGEQLVLAGAELVAVADGLVGGRAAPCTGATTRSGPSCRRPCPCAGRRTCTASRAARRRPRQSRRSGRAGRSGRRRPRRARRRRVRARRSAARRARCRPSSPRPGTRRRACARRAARRGCRSRARGRR